MKPRHCDACGKRLREKHHEIVASDFATGQVLGRYHAGIDFGGCMARAQAYFVPGAVVKATVVHSDRCGVEQEHCDAGAADLGALA